LIVFDTMAAGSGYLSTMLAGIQRPMSEGDLVGFAPVFRFGDFADFVYEA